MKNTNQKMLILLTVILIALCLFYIFQWNKEKDQSNYSNGIKELLVFINFTYLVSELYGIADTLEKYDDEFTRQELDLFEDSLGKDIRTINETGMNFTYLFNPINIDDILIYEQRLWRIEKILSRIIDGEISDESEIHSIGHIIKKHNEQLSDMFYGENQLGLEGINTKEGIMNAMEIIDLMNKEIGEIVNK